MPYLPAFWRDIGPFLPPRNADILLHQTIYFSGHGTTEALTILLVYLGVTLVILGLFDWSGTERPVDADVAEAGRGRSRRSGAVTARPASRPRRDDRSGPGLDLALPT